MLKANDLIKNIVFNTESITNNFLCFFSPKTKMASKCVSKTWLEFSLKPEIIRAKQWLLHHQDKLINAIQGHIEIRLTGDRHHRKQRGLHPTFVFTYFGKPVTRCNNHAWQRALVRAEIKDFRWHDLRHTWASWHVQNGNSLQELQQLGDGPNMKWCCVMRTFQVSI